jgi:hypothetical protein
VKRFFIVLFSALLLSHGAICLAEVSVIKTEGSARRFDDETATKIRALEDALRNAVSSVLESFTSEESALQYSEATGEILNNAADYLLNYRILREGWITHHDVSPTYNEDETLPDEPGPAEPRPTDIPLDELMTPERPVTGVEFYHIWIEAKVDEGQLREDLLRLTGRGEEDIRPVTILILDVFDYATYESIKNDLARIDIVKDISYNSFFTGRIVLTARVQGTADTLLEKLEGQVGERFVLIPSGKDKIIIKAPGEAERIDND